MKKILITQRYEKIGEFKELRDNLDVRLSSLILKLGYIPVLVPTNLIKFLKYPLIMELKFLLDLFFYKDFFLVLNLIFQKNCYH